MKDLLAVAGEPGGAVGHQPLALRGANGLAQIGLAGPAEAALAALGRVQGDDVIAGAEPGDTRSDLLDDTAALMPEDGGENAFRVGPGKGEGVCVAHAGRHDTHEDFALLRPGDVHFLDLQGLACAPGHGRA